MPSPEPTKKKKSVGLSKEELDIFFARIDVATAKSEAIVDSWLIKAGHTIPPKKSQAQIDAEDAALFPEAPLGPTTPSHLSGWLMNQSQLNNNKSLKAKIFTQKGLKASKARDSDEKAESAKRGLRVESSDEEEGRSGLGRAKKMKMIKRPEPADAALKVDQPAQLSTTTAEVNIQNAAAEVVGAHDGRTTLPLQEPGVAGAEPSSKQPKKDRKRAKQVRLEEEQESVNDKKLGTDPEDDIAKNKPGEENGAQATTAQMDIDSEHEATQSGQVASKTPDLDQSGEIGGAAKDKSVTGVPANQSILSKEQKNREKKQRKREKKKRAIGAAQLNSS